MIFDQSCTPFSWASLGQSALVSGAMFVLTAILSVVGATVTRARAFEGEQILIGWGLAVFLMTLNLLFFPHTLFAFCIILAVLAIVPFFLALRRGYFNHPFWIFMLFPIFFVCVRIDQIGFSGWDPFWYWIPNAGFLQLHDAMPSKAVPNILSGRPEYTPALTYITYLSSKIAGGFVVNASGIWSCILAGVFSSMLAREVLDKKNMAINSINGFLWMGVIFILVTIVNPASNPMYTFTGWGDGPIMFGMGILTLWLWRIFENQKNNPGTLLWRDAIYFSLACFAISFTKAGGFVLIILLAVGFLLMGFKNKILKQSLCLMPIFFVPAFLIRELWHRYLSFHKMIATTMDVNITNMKFDLTLAFLHAAKNLILGHSMMFACMFITIILGIIALFKKPNKIHNFFLLAMPILLGYQIAIIGHFIQLGDSVDVSTANGYERYSMHMALLGGVGVFLLLLPFLNKFLAEKSLLPLLPYKKVFLVLVIVAVPLFALLAPQKFMADSYPIECGLRHRVHKIVERLPPATKVMIFDNAVYDNTNLIMIYETMLKALETKLPALYLTNQNIYRHNVETEVIDKYFIKGNLVDALLVASPSDTPKNLAKGQSFPALYQRTGQDKSWQEVVIK